MLFWSEIKHSILLIAILAVIALLAFTLEGSEINDITRIQILGNKYLSENQYLNYSQLESLDQKTDLSIALIRDRIEKHPYIENIDVLILERGITQVKIYEKKMDAVLLSNSKQFMITDNSEIIPLIPSTRNIDLPVIVNNTNKENFQLFGNACNNKKIFCALKIISTAELYDKILYENISEISFNSGDNISLNLSNYSSPIYFGVGNEIEKTVYLSKIFKHMRGNSLTNYLNYVDLRYNNLVYLGFDEQVTTEKESI
jgi:cell division protein FtsQ